MHDPEATYLRGIHAVTAAEAEGVCVQVLPGTHGYRPGWWSPDQVRGLAERDPASVVHMVKPRPEIH